MLDRSERLPAERLVEHAVQCLADGYQPVPGNLAVAAHPLEGFGCPVELAERDEVGPTGRRDQDPMALSRYGAPAPSGRSQVTDASCSLAGRGRIGHRGFP